MFVHILCTITNKHMDVHTGFEQAKRQQSDRIVTAKLQNFTANSLHRHSKFAASCSDSMLCTMSVMQERIAKREKELQALRDINLAADQKVLEIMYAHKIARKRKLLAWICTEAGPPVMWLPKEHTPATQAALDKQLDKFEQWKVSLGFGFRVHNGCRV